MDAKQIEEIAHLMVGSHVGWQARFADAAGISRSHLSNILKGSRPVTPDLQIRLWVACREQAAILKVRAASLGLHAAELKKVVPADVVASPARYSRRRYRAEDTDQGEKG